MLAFAAASRAMYRSRQVLHALRPRLHDGHRATMEFATAVLSDAELRLFSSMEKRDQRHALEVAGRLRDQGVDNDDLLTAALLHDCGKGDVVVWLRILNVLQPRLVRRLADANHNGWRGAAHRLAHHVQLSAEAAAQARSSPTAVRLIGGKPEPDESWMLTLLWAADDAS